jgi:hypothetical protein
MRRPINYSERKLQQRGAERVFFAFGVYAGPTGDRPCVDVIDAKTGEVYKETWSTRSAKAWARRMRLTVVPDSGLAFNPAAAALAYVMMIGWTEADVVGGISSTIDGRGERLVRVAGRRDGQDATAYLHTQQVEGGRTWEVVGEVERADYERNGGR